MIRDKDTIKITMPLTGSSCDMRKGEWSDVQIMENMNAEINTISWDEDNSYSIALK